MNTIGRGPRVHQHRDMSTRRTDTDADEADALVEQAAARRGVPEAETIREGPRPPAMSTWVWGERLAWPTYAGSGEPVTREEITRAVARGAAGQ
jgi:hypothetical protein